MGRILPGGLMNIGGWGRRLAKGILTGAVSASASFTAGVLGRWRSEVPEQRVREIFSGRGFHFLRPHYYLPIPDKADLEAGLDNSAAVILANRAMDEGRRVQFSELQRSTGKRP